MDVVALREKKLTEFAKSYSLNFNDFSNLNSAFIHPSYLNEHKEENIKSYEVLEFMGDAVLKLVVSNFLFKKFPCADEGELTEKRNAVISDASFAKYAKKLNFAHLILFSTGFIYRKFSQDTVLACVFEALFGAIYLDLGYEVCEKFFIEYFGDFVLELANVAHETNYRGILQDYTQRHDGSKPDYKLISEEMIENERYFSYEIFWKDKILGSGRGTSKKLAMANAAKSAVMGLKKRGEL